MMIKKERKRAESILVLFLLISLIFIFLNNNFKNTYTFEKELTTNQNLGIGASQTSNSIFEWNTTWGGFATDSAFSLVIDYDESLYISGNTKSFGAGNGDLFLLKFNNLGILQWNVTWGGIEIEFGGKIVVDSMGYIYLVGRKANGNSDICLIKYNSSGQKEWEKIWGSSVSSYLIPEDIAVDSNDNIYITGTKYNTTTYTADLIIIKLNSSGYEEWMQTWDEGINTVGRSVVLDTLDNIYIAGQKTKSNYDIILLKYNNSGSFKWNRTWGGNNHDIGWAVSTDAVDNVYVMGQTVSFG